MHRFWFAAKLLWINLECVRYAPLLVCSKAALDNFGVRALCTAFGLQQSCFLCDTVTLLFNN